MNTARETPLLGLFVTGALFVAGCASDPSPVAPVADSGMATDIDPQTVEPQYWLGRPAVASVEGNDFDRLWNAADRVARDLLFKIDRQDRRAGVLTTAPTISAQFYEPWRRELQTADDLAESSVATIRRSIRFDFDKEGDRYTVVPKVLVERQTISERRVSGQLTRAYFRRERGQYGSRELDAGEAISDAYWYAIGRDEALEKRIAEKMREHLR